MLITAAVHLMVRIRLYITRLQEHDVGAWDADSICEHVTGLSVYRYSVDSLHCDALKSDLLMNSIARYMDEFTYCWYHFSLVRDCACIHLMYAAPV